MPEHSSILTWMMLLPLLGGVFILAIPGSYAKNARPLAILCALATLTLAIIAASWFDWTRLSYGVGGGGAGGMGGVQLATRWRWIPAIGAQYFVGVDGLSMPLVLLTCAMSVLACWASFGINKSFKAYYALMLFVLASMIGVFISLDLLLFYLFFELALVPMYFLIGLWGGARKEQAALKFFLYMLLGSVAFLIVVLGVYSHTRGAGTGGAGVFDLLRLATDPLLRAKFNYGGSAFHFSQIAFWLLFIGFTVRLPSVPLHSWLADAHAEAPAPVSMLLAGVVVLMGPYGLLRVSYPLFPQQAASFWFVVALVAVVSIVYGALVAMAQKDLQRLVAHWSISGMGYILLGIAVMTPIAMAGAVFQMIAQAISAALMFMIVGVLYDRAHHREIRRLGGIWSQMPAFTGWAVVGFLAAMGLPGLCGFVGELLVLVGTFSAGDAGSPLMRHSNGEAFVALLVFGVIASAAIILTAGYLLWTLQRAFMGAPKPEYHHFARLSRSEKWILAILGIAAVVLGVVPMVILKHIQPAVNGLMRLIAG